MTSIPSSPRSIIITPPKPYSQSSTVNHADAYHQRPIQSSDLATSDTKRAPLIIGATQNAMASPDVPVNGKPSAPAGPAIINSSNITNGAPGNADHSRKPSSVTITSQGTSGTLPNGNANAAHGKPNISFGNFDNAASPASTHSVPHNPQSSLSASRHAPAANRSPSPIPKPHTASGGRPPSSLSGAGALNFGSLPGADGADASLRPGSISQSSGAPPHVRRESSQSQHSDMSSNVGRTFVPNGRGRGGYNPNFHNQPGSPANRPFNMQHRTPSNNPAYPSQTPLRGPNSPYTANRSPAVQAAPMPGQPFYPNGQHMGGPHPGYGYPPQFNPNASAQGMYGMPQQLDPNYQSMYYQQSYMQPGMQYGAPPSPGQYQQPRGAYMQSGYNASPMSRTSSQNPERPASAMSQSQSGQTAALNAGNASPAPQPSVISRAPKRESKAIVIKRPDGGEVNFKKPAAAPAAPVPAKGPTMISSASGTPSSSTPPPRAVDATTPNNTSLKTAEERKAEFVAQFKKQVQVDQPEEESKPVETSPSKEDVKPIEEPKPAPVEDKVEEKKELAAPSPAPAPAPAPAAPEDEEAKKAAEAAEKQRLEDEEMDKMIAEMEAQEKEEEERERAYAEKKAAEKAAKAASSAKSPTDEELKAAEREAEELEAKKAAGDADADSEGLALFAKLKKANIGPGAEAEDSGASTPAPESPVPTPAEPAIKKPVASKGLKIETKPSEPATPTAGMLSLEKAKPIESIKHLSYPDGITLPKAELTGLRYDLDFLLQFQEIFKEKPSITWDKTLQATVGDTSDSARPQSARTPSMAGGRQPSHRGGAPAMGAMGTFASGGRTLPAGTTSADRFRASTQGPPAANPFGQFAGGRQGAFPMNAPMMVRNASAQSLAGQGMGARNASARGKGSRRGPTAAEEAKLAKSMPLTAGMDLKGLEVSKTGWKPMSITQPSAAAAATTGHLAPDVVQRKVKSALNKMTPEKFDKISDEVLVIAGQSKDEQDGRTLRQVIQLTFEKACDEAHWASMYAKFCKRMLETMSTEIKDENVRDKTGTPVVGGALFRKYLLNRCQEEFERGWEANLPDKPEGESTNGEAAMLSDEYYIAAAAKRRGLGLIQFIGELYKLDMLTIRIMHECVVRLLQFEGLPDESAVESLVKLLRTVGGKMEASQNGTAMIDTYFNRIDSVMTMQSLPSRLYYMLLDITDLRKKHWHSKDDQKGPKTITEIHADALAAQAAAEVERQRTAARGGGGGGRMAIGRGDARSFSQQGMPPPDYPRNTVGMDDLKKLAARGSSRANSSMGPSTLGPASMLGSRSSSGRKGLGPLSRGNEDSATSSRTGTPPVKEATSNNAFSALAALDNSGDAENTNASPANSPPTNKAVPAIAEKLEGKGEGA